MEGSEEQITPQVVGQQSTKQTRPKVYSACTEDVQLRDKRGGKYTLPARFLSAALSHSKTEGSLEYNNQSSSSSSSSRKKSQTLKKENSFLSRSSDAQKQFLTTPLPTFNSLPNTSTTTTATNNNNNINNEDNTSTSPSSATATTKDNVDEHENVKLANMGGGGGGMMVVGDDMITNDVYETKGKSTQKKFTKRFGSRFASEYVIEDFICAILLRGAILAQGCMYITRNHVCFYSNLFGKKTIVTIGMEDILLVRKCSLLKIPNSLEIITPTKSYFWASFLHRERAFELIDSIWKKSLHSIGQSPHDVAMRIPTEKSYHHNNNFHYATTTTATTTTTSSTSTSSEELEMEWGGMMEGGGVRAAFSNDEGYPPVTEECKHAVEIPKAAIPHFTQLLPISALEYYRMFLSQRSVGFWKEFHEKGGFLMFELEAWKPTDDVCCCWERKAKFKAPIGFSRYTRVTQTQRVRITNDDQLIFETSSYSKDVPYSTHFLVEAKWVFTNLYQEEGGSGMMSSATTATKTMSGAGGGDVSKCELKIYLNVRFVKQFLLKKIIESTSIDGSKSWFVHWMKSTKRVITTLGNTPNSGDANSKDNINILHSSIHNYKTNNDMNVAVQGVKTSSTDLTEQTKHSPIVHISSSFQRLDDHIFLTLFVVSLFIILFLFILIVFYIYRISITSSALEDEVGRYQSYQSMFTANSNLLSFHHKIEANWQPLLPHFSEFLSLLGQLNKFT